MKRFIYGLVVIGALSCNDRNSTKTFEVEGTIRNTTAKMVYLEENVANSGPVIMDSAEIKDGKFELSAPSKEESLYQLRLEGKLTPFAVFINDVSKLKVQADLNNATQPYIVEGSPASAALINFDKTTYEQGLKIFTLSSKVDSMTKAKAPDSLVSVEFKSLEATAQNFKSSAQEFLKNAKSPVLTLYALGSFQNTANNLGMQGFSQTEVAEFINTAASKFPNHTALHNVKKAIPAAKEGSGATSGVRKAPEFSQPDVNGNPISLSSFKGKYVLIDFWASWCRPCRVENPNVVRAYNEFKDKNFTVFGVSLDQEKDAWQKAIRQDGLAWTHASDLKFWSNEAAALYGVQSIPANFLIDPQGNIIAQDLRGEDLLQTLRKYIK